MNMSIAVTADLERAPINPLLTRLAVAAACTALADWLFFGWDVGLSLALFLGVVGIAAIACNGVHATRPVRIIMTIAFIAGLAALIEDVDTLSVLVGTTATAMFVVVMTAREASSWQRNLFEAVTVPLRGPFQFVIDLLRSSSEFSKDRLPDWLRTHSLIAWIIPIGAFAIFLYLFASANPLIEDQLRQIDFRDAANLFNPLRMIFWLLVISAIWPLIMRKIRKQREATKETIEASVIEPFDWDMLFSALALSRSLVLLNALFALQSALDLTYLWGGATLPHGMSHAEYAHRGAYPLVVTALLAAGFVLIAMRPGGPAEQSRLIRPLVLLWTAQNVLLVISSIFRLDLYVAAYSLTYLRLASFIWMVLVITGLLLMFIQIMQRKSNAWLLATNAIALSLVLYACCFLNAPWLVATYNVEHCREVGGSGPNLDLNYLASLDSAQTLPPVEKHQAQFPQTKELSLAYRASPDRNYLKRPGNWRAWTFRQWRLERYFANTPVKQFDVDPDRG
jgi:Domain of unknown function (DUF4173)